MPADVVSIVRKFVSFHLMKHYYVMRQFDEVTSVVLDFLQFLRKDTSLPADMSAQLDTAIEVRPMPARSASAEYTLRHAVSFALLCFQRCCYGSLYFQKSLQWSSNSMAGSAPPGHRAGCTAAAL